MSERRPRILVVTRHTPFASEDGAGAYLSDLLRYLSKNGYLIDVLWLKPHEHIRWQGLWTVPEELASFAALHLDGAWTFGRKRIFLSVFLQPRLARAKHRIKTILQSLKLWRKHAPSGSTPRQTSLPSNSKWMETMTDAELSIVKTHARRLKPDIILANYAWMTRAFAAAPNAQRVCLHHDVAWQRARVLAKATGKAAELTREQECSLLSAASLILCISERDALELRAMAPSCEVLACP